MNNRNSKIFSTWGGILVVLVLCAFPLFLRLGEAPLHLWDEARLAVSATEMVENGNFLVPHYEGKPDMWGTKPPLMIWLQTASLKLFGLSEFAIRFPSAMAGLLTALLLFLFFQRRGEFWFGLVAALVLVTIPGYVGLHATRTGDRDALLALWTTLYCLSFFAYIENPSPKTKNLFLSITFVALSLAVLTKGVAGLLFTPALALYLLIRKELLTLLKSKAFYANAAIFLIVVAGYYFLREWANPGYLEAVFKNDVARFAQAQETHREGFFFYLQGFRRSSRFLIWLPFLLFGWLVGTFHQKNFIKNLSRYFSLLILCFFLVISTAQTKLRWYDLPLYPLFAILIAVGIVWLWDAAKKALLSQPSPLAKLVPALLLAALLVPPYENILQTVAKSSKKNSHNPLGAYLNEAWRSHKNFSGYKICGEGYRAPVLFYTKMLEKKGCAIEFKDWKNFISSDKVIVSQDEMKRKIESKYRVQVLENNKKVTVYQIL